MVPYIETVLEEGKTYKITPLFDGNLQRFERTIRNLNKMFIAGRPISVVSPEKVLTLSEIEEYRSWFCSYAKQVKRNMIYFQGPVNVEINREG